MMPAANSDQEQVRLLLQRINDAWLQGPVEQIPQKLEDCFHHQMVIRGPDFQELGRGKAACAKSYQDFLNQAKVHRCQLAEPHSDVAGDTAVAACAWEMTYELNGQTYTESGHDLFVFTRDQGRWLAVWRTLLPSR